MFGGTGSYGVGGDGNRGGSSAPFSYAGNTAKEPPLKKRAHYDLRIAHANGAEIEMKVSNNTWAEITNPSFIEHHEYRIKPKEDLISENQP